MVFSRIRKRNLRSKEAGFVPSATLDGQRQARARSAAASKAVAVAMLVLVTVVWGLSFPLVKSWQDAARDCPGGELLATLTLIALRMLLAVPVLAICAPALVTGPTRREYRAGLALGCLFFLGFGLQVLGLSWTSPALCALITSLSSAWVPLLAFLCFRIRLSLLALIGLGFGLVGTGVLAAIDSAGVASFGWGEFLTLLSSVVFGVQILALDRLGRGLRSGYLTVSFLGMAGLLSLGCALVWAAAGPGVGVWITWLRSVVRDQGNVAVLLALTFLCTVLAFHWMNIYQPQVSAARAALIYLLEPIFAAMFSVMVGFESVGWRLLVGGGLILFGNLLVEVPGWLREYRKLPRGDAASGNRRSTEYV